MRRRFLLRSIIMSLVFLFVAAPKSQAVLDSEAVLNRQMAVTLFKENSASVRDAVHNEKIAHKNYESQLAKSKTINTEKVFIYHDDYADEDVFYYYEPEMQMQMRLLKELTPERVKHAWEIRKISTIINENVMANTADSLFLGLYGAYQNVLLSEKSYELAKKAYEREKVRYNNGLITELDLKSSYLDLEESENGFVKAERNYENSHRQFNRLSGLPIDYRFLLIGTPWSYNNKIELTENEAVASALENRMEIWNLQRQIRLAMQQMEIYRHKDVHRSHKDTKENYNKVIEQVTELKLNLLDTEYNIEKEIRDAYKELEICYLDLEMNKQKLLRQKNQLNNIADQYNEGQIPASVIEQMESAVSQMEFVVNTSMITAMNKSDRLYRAISVGPGY